MSVTGIPLTIPPAPSLVTVSVTVSICVTYNLHDELVELLDDDPAVAVVADEEEDASAGPTVDGPSVDCPAPDGPAVPFVAVEVVATLPFGFCFSVFPLLLLSPLF